MYKHPSAKVIHVGKHTTCSSVDLFRVQLIIGDGPDLTRFGQVRGCKFIRIHHPRRKGEGIVHIQGFHDPGMYKFLPGHSAYPFDHLSGYQVEDVVVIVLGAKGRNRFKVLKINQHVPDGEIRA